MSAEEPKKKRRQNVACSCCKLRRIKCDLSDLLHALPSSSTLPTPPLNVLVEQHPEIECTNCKKKGLKCDTLSIREPTRPNKGGKRIDELRKKFGQDDSVEQGQGGSIGDGAFNQNMGGLDQQEDVAGIMDQGLEQIPFDPLEFFKDYPMNPSQPLQTFPLDPPFTPSDLWTNVNPSDQSVASLFDSSTLQSINFPILPSTQHHPFVPPIAESEYQDVDVLPSAPPSVSGRSPSNFQEALSIWQQFANNRKEAMYLVRTTGLTPGADGVQLSEQEITDVDLNGTLQDRVSARFQSSLGSNPSYRSLRDVSDPFSGRLNLPLLSNTPIATPRYIPETPSATYTTGYNDFISGDSRKRSRSPLLTDTELYGQSNKMVLLSQNPWKLYSQNPRNQITIWGRREAVSEQLADRALGMALSNHLVKTFFQAVHLSYPAISPEAFYLEWAKAGQRSDRMTPAQEALCAVIEAWGARYSDSPVVLGLSEAKANAAPKVIQADGTFAPGTRARTHWGKARLAACKALMDRAKRLIDENGLYRQPSITGVQALTLFSQLMHMTDEKVLDKDHWLQNRMIHSTIIEQMQLLGLMWDTDGPIVTDDEEATISFSQLQMKQRRLFWTHMVGDAFFSASIGMLPKISQEDVDSAGEWIDTVQDRLPHSSFKLLAFFLSVYHRLGLAGREVASKVAYPLRRKGAADVGKICMTVRKIWKDVRGISKDLNIKVTDLLQSCRKDDLLGFSPLNFLANLRLSCPFLLLVIHQLIRDQLEFWKTCQVSSAFISTPSDNTSSTPSSTSFNSRASSGQRDMPSKKNIELLERLNRESVDGLLSSCRGQIKMLESIIPTGVIQSASILLRVLIATAQLLAEVPTNEQGYPSNTPGGYGWTWETKKKDVDICLEALHQVGWAWADVGDICDSVVLTMERMTPSAEQLSAWKTKQQEDENKASEEIIKAKDDEAQASEKAVESVLVFWPPISIPQLIENAISENPKAILDSGIPNMTNHLQQPRYNLNTPKSDSGQAPYTPPSAPSARFMREGIHKSTIGDDNPLGPMFDQPSPQPATSEFDTATWIDGLTNPTAEGLGGVSGEWSPSNPNHQPQPGYEEPFLQALTAQTYIPTSSTFESSSSSSGPPINLQSVLSQPIIDLNLENHTAPHHNSNNHWSTSNHGQNDYQISHPHSQFGLEGQGNEPTTIPELDVQAFLNELGIPQGTVLSHTENN